jgi:hypothetical protein
LGGYPLIYFVLDPSHSLRAQIYLGRKRWVVPLALGIGFVVDRCARKPRLGFDLPTPEDFQMLGHFLHLSAIARKYWHGSLFSTSGDD